MEPARKVGGSAVGYEYGNARVASRRGRLLDRDMLTHLAESATMAAVAAQLERSDDWAPILRQASALGDPATVLDAAIELHRSARWGALPSWYEGRPRRLVEALVLPLDAERVIAVQRRRRGGEPLDEIASSVIPGALLGARDLARVARAAGPAASLEPLVLRAVLSAADAVELAAAETAGRSTADLESMLLAAVERSRRARAGGRGSDAAAVRQMLERSADEIDAVVVELDEGGPTVATLLQRSTRLARLDALAALGRRDPLGIGAVAGYLAAVEVQAIRLRAVVARVRSAWTFEDAAPYLAATAERTAWPVSSS